MCAPLGPMQFSAKTWGGGGKKHEIYAVAFGGHIFYDLFLQGSLGLPAGSATVSRQGTNVVDFPFTRNVCKTYLKVYSEVNQILLCNKILKYQRRMKHQRQKSNEILHLAD